MTAIDITKLSPEERKKVVEQAKELERQEKEKRAADKKALEDLKNEAFPAAWEMIKQASEMQKKAKEIIYSNFMNYLKLKVELQGASSIQRSHTMTVGK